MQNRRCYQAEKYGFQKEEVCLIRFHPDLVVFCMPFGAILGK